MNLLYAAWFQPLEIFVFCFHESLGIIASWELFIHCCQTSLQDIFFCDCFWMQIHWMGHMSCILGHAADVQQSIAHSSFFNLHFYLWVWGALSFPHLIALTNLHRNNLWGKCGEDPNGILRLKKKQTILGFVKQIIRAIYSSKPERMFSSC